jgi:hypothetical protein
MKAIEKHFSMYFVYFCAIKTFIKICSHFWNNSFFYMAEKMFLCIWQSICPLLCIFWTDGMKLKLFGRNDNYNEMMFMHVGQGHT